MSEPTSGPVAVRRGPSSRLSAVFFTVVTLFGLGYLAAIPFGLVGANKFGSAEAIIFAALLFFNSALIGRMESLVLSGRGVEVRSTPLEPAVRGDQPVRGPPPRDAPSRLAIERHVFGRERWRMFGPCEIDPT